MVVDPLYHELIEEEQNGVQGDMIIHVETSCAWTLWRDELAQEMFNR